MSKSKENQYAVWFVNVSKYPSYIANAKCKQLYDWVGVKKPFGNDFGVIIIPSDENKVCILKSEKEFMSELKGDSIEWIANIKDRLEECLTIHLNCEEK